MKVGIFSQNVSTMETNNAELEGFFDDSPKNVTLLIRDCINTFKI